MEAISSCFSPYAISRSLPAQIRRKTQSCALFCCPSPLFEFPRGELCRNRSLVLRNNVKFRPLLVASAASEGNGVSVNLSAEPSAGDTSVVSFNKESVPTTGSLKWILGPASLIASVLIPQLFLSGYIESALKDEILAEILASISSEALFYMGLEIFLYITKRVQQPYHGLSQRWNLITDHNSYLYSSYLTMGIKVFAPLLVAYLVWPVIGLPAAIAVAPFLLGLAVQYAFEERFHTTGSSCWPILPIIFEVYRLYQLNKGAHFVERLLFSSGRAATRELLERRSALVSLLVVFQALGLVCMWCFATFLMRLLPAELPTEN